jgi:hypothetical protein
MVTDILRGYYMSFPSHPPSLDHPNYIWRGVQVKKLLIILVFIRQAKFLFLV